MLIRITTTLALLFSLILVTSCAPPAYPQRAVHAHPLDPLTKTEISAVVSVLKSTGNITLETRFAQIYLKEPPKSQVMADIAAGGDGEPDSLCLYNWTSGVASEVVVDLDRRAVVSWYDLPWDHPPLRNVAGPRVDEIVRADGRWWAAAQKRGVQDPAQVAILAQVGELRKLEQRNGDRFVNAIFFFEE